MCFSNKRHTLPLRLGFGFIPWSLGLDSWSHHMKPLSLLWGRTSDWARDFLHCRVLKSQVKVGYGAKQPMQGDAEVEIRI